MRSLKKLFCKRIDFKPHKKDTGYDTTELKIELYECDK